MHQAYLDKLAQTIKQTVRKGEAKDIKIKVTTKVESGELRWTPLLGQQGG
jgi:hypothetical protein